VSPRAIGIPVQSEDVMFKKSALMAVSAASMTLAGWTAYAGDPK
jgi:hypothetical protein